MARPSRPSDPNQATGEPRTFFVTTKTAQSRRLLQSDRMANALIEVLREYMRAKRFLVHDFVIMPDHLHILMTVPGDCSIKRAVQLIKGNFSFRAKRELAFPGEVWQRGFSDVRITDEQSFEHHREYIYQNPVRAGLVKTPEEYPYGTAYLKRIKRNFGGRRG